MLTYEAKLAPKATRALSVTRNTMAGGYRPARPKIDRHEGASSLLWCRACLATIRLLLEEPLPTGWVPDRPHPHAGGSPTSYRCPACAGPESKEG